MAETRFKVNLPSRCKVYDVDPASITIRTLKGKDEKIIAEITSDNLVLKMNQLLENVLEGIDPRKLTLGDRQYLLLWLATNSYGKDYPVEVVCEGCGQLISVTVDLSKLEVEYLPEDYSEPYEVQLSDGKSVYLRLFRVEDEMDILEWESQGKNSWLYRYALTLVDESKNIIEKMKFLEDLEAKDLAKIRAFHEKFDHGPIMESKYECPYCGFKGVMAVPFRIEMVFPIGPTLRRNFAEGV